MAPDYSRVYTLGYDIDRTILFLVYFLVMAQKAMERSTQGISLPVLIRSEVIQGWSEGRDRVVLSSRSSAALDSSLILQISGEFVQLSPIYLGTPLCLVLICLVWFYDISTIVGYFMPNRVYTYILNIQDL